MPTDEKMIVSKSETIGVMQIRQLLELTNTLKAALTQEEFLNIVSVYNGCIGRLLKENGEPL